MLQMEEQQARQGLQERVSRLEAELASERSVRAQEKEKAQAQAQRLFDRLREAEAASAELWEDAAIVLSQQRGTPEELQMLLQHPNSDEEEDIRSLLLEQLPGEDVAAEERFEAAVELAGKLHRLKNREAELAAVEMKTLAERCTRHEQYIEMLDRTKKRQPQRGVNSGSRDNMLVSKIATCLARGYSVKEGTQSEVQLLRRKLQDHGIDVKA
jgi:hypothetical protein